MRVKLSLLVEDSLFRTNVSLEKREKQTKTAYKPAARSHPPAWTKDVLGLLTITTVVAFICFRCSLNAKRPDSHHKTLPKDKRGNHRNQVKENMAMKTLKMHLSLQQLKSYCNTECNPITMQTFQFTTPWCPVLLTISCADCMLGHGTHP